MLADLNIARKLSLLLILPMATFLFLVAVESIERWKDIDELKFVERSLVVNFSAGELITRAYRKSGATPLAIWAARAKSLPLSFPTR